MNRKQHVTELCEQVQRDLKLAGLPRHGCATDGTDYSSILAMWSSELGYGTTAVGVDTFCKLSAMCVFASYAPHVCVICDPPHHHSTP